MLKRVLRFWKVIAVVAVVGFFWGCPPPLAVPVLITGTFPSASFNPDPVTVDPGQQIQWTNSTNATITLQLQLAPVSDSTLVIEANATGEVSVDDDAAQGQYKYGALLVLGDSTVVIDPYIDVQPKR